MSRHALVLKSLRDPDSDDDIHLIEVRVGFQIGNYDGLRRLAGTRKLVHLMLQVPEDLSGEAPMKLAENAERRQKIRGGDQTNRNARLIQRERRRRHAGLSRLRVPIEEDQSIL